MTLDYKYYLVITVEGNHYHFGAEDLEDCKEQFANLNTGERIDSIYLNVYDNVEVWGEAS